ncbi:MAG: DUF1653 domain-containing protein [Candidatus Aenigmarchaeota archaeon]|nr:DUF1653 domain-containing protein [Candidatus Aenigmarchaeota archaeon]
MSNIKLSPKAKSLKLGLYEHYKGGRYQVLGVAIHSETLEELVIYKALYDERLVWLRPLKMFLENVEVDGIKKPRFKYIGKEGEFTKHL